MNNKDEDIEHLLKKYFATTISAEERKRLSDYLLSRPHVADKYGIDGLLASHFAKEANRCHCSKGEDYDSFIDSLEVPKKTRHSLPMLKTAQQQRLDIFYKIAAATVAIVFASSIVRMWVFQAYHGGDMQQAVAEMPRVVDEPLNVVANVWSLKEMKVGEAREATKPQKMKVKKTREPKNLVAENMENTLIADSKTTTTEDVYDQWDIYCNTGCNNQDAVNLIFSALA